MSNGTSPTWAFPKFSVGTGISTTFQNRPTAFTFQASNNKPILTITGDGDVIWNGKPSEAAGILVNSFQLAVEDTKGVTKAARRRYYYKACKNLLDKAEKMEYEDFIDFLQKQVYNRERTIIMDALTNEQN